MFLKLNLFKNANGQIAKLMIDYLDGKLNINL